MGICISVCPFAHQNTRPNFTKLPVAVAQFSSDGNAICTYFRFCGWRHVFT